MAVVCKLIANPVYAKKKCTEYNSLTILLRFIYSKCKPLYVNWSMYMPLSGCLAVYYNYDY